MGLLIFFFFCSLRLLRQVEGASHLGHLFVAHTFGLAVTNEKAPRIITTHGARWYHVLLTKILFVMRNSIIYCV